MWGSYFFGAYHWTAYYWSAGQGYSPYVYNAVININRRARLVGRDRQ